MRVDYLALQGVRNLRSVALEPRARFNVFSGDNGQGKTNLLETIFVVAALRSFRTAKLADLIAFGEPTATISARVIRSGLTRIYELAIEPHSKKIRLDGKSPRPLARYFGDFNVVLFAPEDLQLPRGSPSERRKFLDRAVFNHAPAYLVTVQDYEKVLRSRNRILRSIADGATPKNQADDLIAVYDQQLSELAATIIIARTTYLRELLPGFRAAFEAIARMGIDVDLTYVASAELDNQWAGRVAETVLAALQASRPRDLARGTTSVGPHRDDLCFMFGGRDAGSFASQGQLRAVVLAWKTAEMELLTRVHGDPPILLLDDVSSELDPSRNRYLFEHLAQLAGQCFVTTTAASHVLIANERADYIIRDGEIVNDLVSL